MINLNMINLNSSNIINEQLSDLHFKTGFGKNRRNVKADH